MSTKKINVVKDNGYKATASCVCCSTLLCVEAYPFLNRVNFYVFIIVLLFLCSFSFKIVKGTSLWYLFVPSKFNFDAQMVMNDISTRYT